MEDLQYIKANYKRFSDEELIAIAQSPQHLRPEVLPVLRAELQSRQLPDPVIATDNETGFDGSAAAIEAIQQEVAERLQSGESIDSIKADLQERGIDVFDLLDRQQKEEALFLDELTQLKTLGFNNEAIQQQFITEQKMSEDEAAQAIIFLKKEGRKNRIKGVLFTVVALLILCCTWGLTDKYGQGTIIVPYGALLYGVVTFIKGCKQGQD